MKKHFTWIALSLTLLSSTSFAEPTTLSLTDNYQTCMASDSSWYNRWGAYLVSFNRNEAYKICRSIYQNADIKMMGCRVNGHWLNAGYYCDFEH